MDLWPNNKASEEHPTTLITLIIRGSSVRGVGLLLIVLIFYSKSTPSHYISTPTVNYFKSTGTLRISNMNSRTLSDNSCSCQSSLFRVFSKRGCPCQQHHHHNRWPSITALSELALVTSKQTSILCSFLSLDRMKTGMYSSLCWPTALREAPVSMMGRWN